MINHYTALLTFLGSFHMIPLILLVLAIFSITRLIVEDIIVEPIRDRLFHHFPPDGYTSDAKPLRGNSARISQGKWYTEKGTKIGELFSCPWCSGFYVALVIFVFALWSPIWTSFLTAPMALRVIPGLFHH